MNQEFDLFGQPIIKDVLLREKFLEPPFSILDTRGGAWQARKRSWASKGIKSEIGRGENLTHNIPIGSWDSKEEYHSEENQKLNTSIFDPALTELMYRWFCPELGSILDPFAGGSVRGVVAGYLGYSYLGIELREEQVASNREQGKIISPDNIPHWICGDSDKELDKLRDSCKDKKYNFDMIFSCPPYADLEVYSDHPDDLSNMNYQDFIKKYTSIIAKSLTLLKPGGYAVFVVGEVRDKDGNYYDFVGDTKRAFMLSGAKFYNDAILMNCVGSASMRTRQFEVNKKLVKIHQNVLVFRK